MCVEVRAKSAHAVTHLLIRKAGASCGQENRTVVVRDHPDCFLHGWPCGYDGDLRQAYSCAPGVLVATRSESVDRCWTASTSIWTCRAFPTSSSQIAGRVSSP